jgi:hypothetical protein
MMKTKHDWVYPLPSENGSEFCRRMGWGPGTTIARLVGLDGYESDGGLRELVNYETISALDAGDDGCDVEVGKGHRTRLVLDGFRNPWTGKETTWPLANSWRPANIV